MNLFDILVARKMSNGGGRSDNGLRIAAVSVTVGEGISDSIMGAFVEEGGFTTPMHQLNAGTTYQLTLVLGKLNTDNLYVGYVALSHVNYGEYSVVTNGHIEIMGPTFIVSGDCSIELVPSEG